MANQVTVVKLTAARGLAAAPALAPAPTGVYPNPVADRLAVAGAAAGTPALARDLLGRVVLAARLGAGGTLDVRALPPGAYLLRLGAGSETHRFVKFGR